MSVVEVQGGPLTMYQLGHWSKDRLIAEVGFTEDAIRRITGREVEGSQPAAVLRCWSNETVARHLLERYRLHEQAVQEGT